MARAFTASSGVVTMGKKDVNWTNKNKSRNDLYKLMVHSSVRGLARASMISAASAAYAAAVRTTWQDSGRAANNWRMSPTGSENLSVDAARNSFPVGKSGEQRSALGSESEVVDAKLYAYGVREGMPATSEYAVAVVGNPSDRGFFGGAAASKVREVTIYNPIGRKMGTYPERAFNKPGRDVLTAMKLATSEQILFLKEAVKAAGSPKNLLGMLSRWYR